MSSIFKISFLLCLGIGINCSFAYQKNTVDSLVKVLANTVDFEEKIDVLLQLGDQYFDYNNDTALYYYENAYVLAKKLNDKELITSTAFQLGAVYLYKDRTKSTEYLLQSIKYAEETNNPKYISLGRNALGNIYRMNGDLESAMKEHKYALKVSEAAGDSLQMARCYNNIGIVHMISAEYDEGLDWWLRSLDIKLKIGAEESAAATMSNIALYYKDIGRYFEAKEMLEEAIEINLKHKDYNSTAFCYMVIGDMHWRMDNPFEAVGAYKKSIAYSDTIDSYMGLPDAYIGLSRVLDSLGRYKEALEYQRLYTDLVMEIQDTNSAKITRELTKKYETEKKDQENAILRGKNEAKDAKIALKEANNRYLWIGLVLAGVIMVLIVFVLARVRQAKIQIEEQKNIVEEKNREITDSISYAKRLQDAILPTDETVNAAFKDCFVLYLPKDIVAGDFYWMETVNEKVMFAVADCTGHGVPGAMVSVVCNNGLNRAVREFQLTDPGKILDKVTDLVIETFEKSTEEVRDGMDISLCVFDFKANEVHYAGANNSLYHLKNGELIEYRPNKQPVGKYGDRKSFDTHIISFSEGDIFYQFTDGFADQFGGEKGKKLKYKPFKKILLTNQKRAMKAQKIALIESFDRWKGDLEQIDDVCIVGIKV